MSYQKRTTLSNLLNTNWYQSAVSRTGVAMPNCFTYAMARVSEIIGYAQPLDVTRVRGAGDLWENHAPEFRQEKYAREGALMIWKGGAGNYGHVAVCEELIDVNTIGWGESNYGGAMFLYQKRNPNGYAGLRFMGYLVHKDLPVVEEAPAPEQPAPSSGEILNEVPSDFNYELWHFTCGDSNVNIRRAPSTSGQLTGDWYEPGMSFNYDGFVRREGYVWLSYIGKDGTRRWVAGGELNANGVRVVSYGSFD